MYTVKTISEVNDNVIRKYELIYNKSLPYLKPNLMRMDNILKKLKEKYSIEEFDNAEFLKVVAKNTDYKYGKTMDSNILGYRIINDTSSKDLFSKREVEFENMEYIYFGINLENNGFYVEGSTLLHNDLVYMRGLSEEELDNIWLTCEYIMICNE